LTRCGNNSLAAGIDRIISASFIFDQRTADSLVGCATRKLPFCKRIEAKQHRDFSAIQSGFSARMAIDGPNRNNFELGKHGRSRTNGAMGR
jgi:hypothetical protein